MSDDPQIEHEQDEDFGTKLNSVTAGFRVSMPLMGDIGGDNKAPQAKILYDLARRLVDSVLFSWKSGDREVEFRVNFLCASPGEHTHEGPPLTALSNHGEEK
jgi:hypothetical protein